MLGPATELVYVGSNLGDAPPASREAPLPGPVVFSITAAGMNVDWVVAAADALGASPALIVLGTSAVSARRHDGVAPWFDPSWDWRGHLPAPEVLRALSRASLVLAPYIDGATGRRTSLLAALSTGARVITSRGHLLDPVLAGGPVGVAGTREEFAAMARQVWRSPDSPQQRAQRVAWYRQHFDTNRLDQRLLQLVLGPTP
jgi:hypothetical protein